MMNELQYDEKREIVSLFVFQCVKIRVCNSVPGITMELLRDVRQDFSDVCANMSHGLLVILLIFFILFNFPVLDYFLIIIIYFFFLPKSNVILCEFVYQCLY